MSPGDYTIGAHATFDVEGTTVEERAWMPLTVAGSSIDNVSLYTTAGWHIAGRVTTETGDTTTVPRDRIGISAAPAGDYDATRHSRTVGSGRVREDWTFQVNDIPGPARIRVHLPDGWAVKSLLHEGVDAADRVFELRSGETLNGIDVVLTNQVTSVSGQVVDVKGKPALDCTVLIFSVDPEHWVEGTSYVRASRPDQQGRYEVRGLPPGEYLAIALEYVEDKIWNDPEFLGSLREHARSFRLADAESREAQLTVVTPPR